jgi:hypothetical protein
MNRGQVSSNPIKTKLIRIVLIIFWFSTVGGFINSYVMASHLVTLSEDVTRTKHNLVANPDILAVGTTEVCVFCHTPHGGTRVEPDSSAPLWNRMLPGKTGYSMYTQSPNFDGSDIGISPRGVSLACLSCHDGTIALDALVNAPNSGGFIKSNLQPGIGPGISDPSISFISAGIVDSDSTLREGLRDSFDEDKTSESPGSGGLHDTVTGGSGPEGAEPFPNLSRDLIDDHPVSMEVPAPRFNFRGGKVDVQFGFIGAGSDLDGGEDGADVLFIRRSDQPNWPTDKRDRLRAYPSTSTVGSYYIECASCHNPHTPRVSFLRLPSGSPGLVTTDLTPTSTAGHPRGKTWAQAPNAGSAICVSCHEK